MFRVFCAFGQICRRNYSECSLTQSVCGKLNEAMCANEAPLLNNGNVMEPHKVEELLRREKCKVIVEGQTEIENVNGTIEGIRKVRRARIYQPPKNVMQSGTQNTYIWMMDFNRKANWENPCVGYSSGSDPIQGLRIQFKHKEDAIAFAEKNGWKWYVQETWNIKPFKQRTYASNYSFNKRTRVSTK